MIRITVLVSGSGSNLQAIIDACRNGYIEGEVVLVISDRYGVYALERARRAGIETAVVERKNYSGEEQFSGEITRLAKSEKTDIICLAGFLKKLGKNIVSEYEGRILNIHPALLPSHGGKGMYGLKVHTSVLEAGDKETGCTVHIVDDEYDRGPVFMQKKVEVKNGDTPETLARRVLKAEHKLYPAAIKKISEELKR